MSEGLADWESVVLAGQNLDELRVPLLEEMIERDPGDLETRLKLLGRARSTSYPHVLWVIEHIPEHEIAGSPYCLVVEADPIYNAACAAWERAIENSAGRPGIFLNAARFFRGERGRTLLERGECEAPSWPEWGDRLGDHAMKVVRRARRREDRGYPPLHKELEIFAHAEAALAHYERALPLATSTDWRFLLLERCARSALEAVQLADALHYAEATIAMAAEHLDYLHRFDYLHMAHIVRGRVALSNNDLTDACAELAAAGLHGSSGATFLRWFGPDFRLARLLLERDEVDAVLAYLDRCATFWSPKIIASWRDAIVRGDKIHMYGR